MEQNPNMVQGGPLVEQVVTEALGENWISNSLIASIALQGGVPQSAASRSGHCLRFCRSPLTINVMSVITDLDETTGGTLIIPRHSPNPADAVREQRPAGKLPPAINLDAKAGTVVITDGRLIHSTGINHTDSPRIVMLNGMQHPVIRQQENWMLSVKPEVLKRASPKLLQRMGYQATNAAQTNEGHGFGASGAVGEAADRRWISALLQTTEITSGVGALGPDSAPEELNAPYTLREVVTKARAGGRSAPVGIAGIKRNL